MNAEVNNCKVGLCQDLGKSKERERTRYQRLISILQVQYNELAPVTVMSAAAEYSCLKAPDTGPLSRPRLLTRPYVAFCSTLSLS